MMKRLLTIAMVIAACSPAQPAATTIQSTTPTTSSPLATTTTLSPPTTAPEVLVVGDLGILAMPGPDGGYPANTPVSCGIGGIFPFGSLENIRPIEDGVPDGVAAGVAAWLGNEEGTNWPQTGWHVLNETDSEMTLVARSAGGLADMHFELEDGMWMWSGAGLGGDVPCRLQFTVPSGLHTVIWELDPAAPDLDSSTTEIPLLLTERNCASGLEIGDRLLGPEILMSETEVRIAFAAEPPPGDAFTCQGIEPMSYVLTLPEPLGDRELVRSMDIGFNLEDFLP